MSISNKIGGIPVKRDILKLPGQITFRCDLRGWDPKIREPVLRSMLMYLPRSEVSSDFVDSNHPRQLREVCCWRPKNQAQNWLCSGRDGAVFLEFRAKRWHTHSRT